MVRPWTESRPLSHVGNGALRSEWPIYLAANALRSHRSKKEASSRNLLRSHPPTVGITEAGKRFALMHRYLRAFHDAEVAIRAGAKCLKRPLVSLAFVSRAGDVIAVEFDNDRRLL